MSKKQKKKLGESFTDHEVLTKKPIKPTSLGVKAVLFVAVVDSNLVKNW